MKLNNLNKRTKKEQILILLLLCTGVFGIMCLTGCGGKKCEKPNCEHVNSNGLEVTACTVPGCGGCLTSGKGCNSSCWEQSCGYGSIKTDGVEMKSCGVTYYGSNGCVGCGNKEKESGYIKANYYGVKVSGIQHEGRLYGCVNGKCKGGEYIDELEEVD